ncbi:acyl--CoA ligase [Actinomycetaceae bacterium TAE3-ERU4]|nr:acyl--CoA ligase [Actinomycetaceae bacterium TAE3-ERU4]
MNALDYSAARLLSESAARHPQRPSLVVCPPTPVAPKSVAEYQIWSVSEANRDSCALAAFFSSLGVCHGDVVMVIARNSPWHMLAYTATTHLGAIVSPVSWRLTTAELTAITAAVTPKLIITESDLVDNLPSALINRVITVEELPEILGNQASPIPVRAMISANTPAAILFTSGSTGSPKAVCLSASQLWWGWQNFRAGFEYSTADITMAAAPFSHIGGFNGTTNDIFVNGGTLVIEPDFQPARILSDIENLRVNMMFAVPTMYAALTKQTGWETSNLDSFRLPLIGGAPPSLALMKNLSQKGLNPINVYGMTETAGAGLCASPEVTLKHPGSVGSPFPYIQARVTKPQNGQIATDLEDVPDGQEGILTLRGPGVITEYLNNHNENIARFNEGWLITGDIVRRTNGIFTIVGRQSDMIISGGENIHPAEIENALADMPALLGVLALGLPDEHWGEKVALMAVPANPENPPTLEQIHHHLENKIARFKVPRELFLAPRIPLNSNGKPDRLAARRELVS